MNHIAPCPRMEMLIKGMLTPEQFRTSPFKNYLTRCVGHEGRVEIDKTPVELKVDDWIILCTDGLSGVVDEEEICEIVEESDTPEQTCQLLLEKTLDEGAPDNVTIVTIHYSVVVAADKPTKRSRKTKSE